MTTHEGDAVRVWSSTTGEILRTVTLAEETMGGGTWSPNGSLIAATAASGMVRSWNAETGDVLFSFTTEGVPVSIHWHPGGERVSITGTGIHNPIIRRAWESTDDAIADAYDCCVTRELTAEERELYGLPERSDG